MRTATPEAYDPAAATVNKLGNNKLCVDLFVGAPALTNTAPPCC